MDQKVADYFNKQEPLQKEICLALRKILLETLHEVEEEMKWGAVVYDGGKYYIAVVRYGVNLGFAVNGLSKEEMNLFEGNGKTMRHLKINSLKEIDEARLVKLIKLVQKKVVCDYGH